MKWKISCRYYATGLALMFKVGEAFYKCCMLYVHHIHIGRVILDNFFNLNDKYLLFLIPIKYLCFRILCNYTQIKHSLIIKANVQLNSAILGLNIFYMEFMTVLLFFWGQVCTKIIFLTICFGSSWKHCICLIVYWLIFFIFIKYRNNVLSFMWTVIMDGPFYCLLYILAAISRGGSKMCCWISDLGSKNEWLEIAVGFNLNIGGKVKSISHNNIYIGVKLRTSHLLAESVSKTL